MRVSATMLNTLQNCEGSAKARLDGIYGSPSRKAFTGNLAHRLFARRLEEGKPIEDIRQACREEIGRSGLSRDMAEVGLKRMADLEPIFREMEDYMARFEAIVPFDEFREAEQYIEQDRGDGVVLLGRIDAVFEGPRLEDWKTGRLSNVRAQLLFYALVWRMMTGVTVKEVEAISFNTGDVYREDVDDELLDSIGIHVTGEISRLQELLEGRDPELTPGPFCSWCPVRITCPAAPS